MQDTTKSTQQQCKDNKDHHFFFLHCLLFTRPLFKFSSLASTRHCSFSVSDNVFQAALFSGVIPFSFRNTLNPDKEPCFF